MQDVLLGIWGDPQETGKLFDNNLASHTHTLPVLYDLKMSKRFKGKWTTGEILTGEGSLISSWLMKDGVFLKTESEMKKLGDNTDTIMRDMSFYSSERTSLLEELISKLRTRKR